MSATDPRQHPKYVGAKGVGQEITELFVYITAATCDLLILIRESDAEGLWQDPGDCSCAHWLNWQCDIGMNAAREKVRAARALADLPNISESFRRGEISYTKVRAKTREAHAENEEFLLRVARHATADHVETLVQGYRRAVRLNDEEQQDKQHEQRSLANRWDDDGSLVLKGRLPARSGPCPSTRWRAQSIIKPPKPTLPRKHGRRSTNVGPTPSPRWRSPAWSTARPNPPRRTVTR